MEKINKMLARPLCADVPLRTYSLTRSLNYNFPDESGTGWFWTRISGHKQFCCCGTDLFV